MSTRDAAIEEPLGMAERHYRAGLACVARQETLINELALHGHDTTLSRILLQTMRVTLGLMREHVEHARRRRSLENLPGKL